MLLNSPVIIWVIVVCVISVGSTIIAGHLVAISWVAIEAISLTRASRIVIESLSGGTPCYVIVIMVA